MSAKTKDYTDVTYNGLTFIKNIGRKNTYANVWLVRCSCGNIFNQRPCMILNNSVKSCGCKTNRKMINNVKIPYIANTRYLDYRGIIHNRLEFVTPIIVEDKRYWQIRCYCGKLFNSDSTSIIRNHRQSCGCIRKRKWGKTRNRARGVNHPKYNPNLSDAHRVRHRQNPEDIQWRREVLERDNYICQLCNHKYKLKCHHLNGFLWAVNERHDVNNGIVLCDNCHKVFHKEYGVGQNTKEQFCEFKRNFQFAKFIPKKDISLYEDRWSNVLCSC